jgi:hypothetical protein
MDPPHNDDAVGQHWQNLEILRRKSLGDNIPQKLKMDNTLWNFKET